jgi:hypothetical protein
MIDGGDFKYIFGLMLFNIEDNTKCYTLLAQNEPKTAIVCNLGTQMIVRPSVPTNITTLLIKDYRSYKQLVKKLDPLLNALIPELFKFLPSDQ